MVRLGAGSFGQVWLASAEKGDGIRHCYALKVQSKYQLIQTGQAEATVSEKNIMARLCDPFIIRLINTYQDDKRAYMLTGLLQGGELSHVLDTSEHYFISEDDAKFYAAGILEGLTHMHRRKIVHRDLKPQNVMINERGYPVIIDLGFGKSIYSLKMPSLEQRITILIRLHCSCYTILSQVCARQDVHFLWDAMLPCTRGDSLPGP